MGYNAEASFKNPALKHPNRKSTLKMIFFLPFRSLFLSLWMGVGDGDRQSCLDFDERIDPSPGKEMLSRAELPW